MKLRDKETAWQYQIFQTLMLPVLRVAAEGEIRISDAVEKLSAEFGLSPEERSHLLPSGRQTTFSNRVHWAKSYLGKAGLVELTKRGHFRATDQGHKVLAAPPERIDIKYLNRFPGFQQFREASEDKESVNIASSAPPVAGMRQALTPDEVMRSAKSSTGSRFSRRAYAKNSFWHPRIFREFGGASPGWHGLWWLGH